MMIGSQVLDAVSRRLSSHNRHRNVTIPKLSEKDLVDVPEEAKQKLKFIPVENADEVLNVALEKNGAPKQRPGGSSIATTSDIRQRNFWFGNHEISASAFFAQRKAVGCCSDLAADYFHSQNSDRVLPSASTSYSNTTAILFSRDHLGGIV